MPPQNLASNLTVPVSDKRPPRRPSNVAESGTAKATAAAPSPSKGNATGQSASNNQTSSVHQRLQSSNISDVPIQDSNRQDKHDIKITETADGPSRDQSNPVQVPSARSTVQHDPYPPFSPSGPPPNTYYGASAHLRRPPRLPLPIGDATATPGSPIIGPAESQMAEPPDDRILDEQTKQDTSTSNTTIDEDINADELQTYAVPTLIKWTGAGHKIYVTGTFVNWEKKFRLHRNENNPRIMSTTLNLRPGTHHLKFIVDGDMRASDDLPTAVDFTNHLVNYVEVSPDDVHRSRGVTVPPGIHPPQVLPELLGTERIGDNVKDTTEKEEEPEEEIPIGDFRRIIPPFLVDLDKEEDGPAYQQAVNIIGDASAPPSLPLFLGKSILNGTTPMKDDNSVLNYPNHTVLNHLATSSIKNGVLATSVTTRYKRKYVTTILYKPTSDVTG